MRVKHALWAVVVLVLVLVRSAAAGDAATVTIASAGPSSVVAGGRIDFTAGVTNTGTTTWTPIGTTFSPTLTSGGPITYPNESGSYYLQLMVLNLDAANPYASPLTTVVPLPTILSPGQSANVVSYFNAPSQAGHWVLAPYVSKVFVHGFGSTIFNSNQDAYNGSPHFAFTVSSASVDLASVTIATAGPSSVVSGGRVDFTVGVTNTGTTTWTPIGTTFSPTLTSGGPISYPNEMGAYYLDLMVLNQDAANPYASPLYTVVPLPKVLSPGQSANLVSYFNAPSQAGHWVLVPYVVKVFVYGFGSTIFNSPQDGYNGSPHFPFTVTSTPPSSGLLFYPVSTCRAFDTRLAYGGAGPLSAGEFRTFQVGGKCGVPTDAGAVSLNVTVTNIQGVGYLRTYPEAGAPTRDVSTLNYSSNQWALANAAIVPLRAGGAFTAAAEATQVDVIFDVNGYFK